MVAGQLDGYLISNVRSFVDDENQTGSIPSLLNFLENELKESKVNEDAMTSEDIKSGGKFADWAKRLSASVKTLAALTKGKLSFKQVEPYDAVSGPFVSVAIDGKPDKVWTIKDDAGEELFFIENQHLIGKLELLASALLGDNVALADSQKLYKSLAESKKLDVAPVVEEAKGQVKITALVVDWKENFDPADIFNSANAVGGKRDIYNMDVGSDDNIMLFSSINLTPEEIKRIADAGDLFVADKVWSGASVDDIIKQLEAYSVEQSGGEKVIKESKIKDIKVKNPGLLNVPEGKKFWQLPLSHYVSLGKSKGKPAVMRALSNLARWNKKQAKPVSDRAKRIVDSLKKNKDWVALSESETIAPETWAKVKDLAERLILVEHLRASKDLNEAKDKFVTETLAIKLNESEQELVFEAVLNLKGIRA